jgi:hypothetical protein
MIRSWCEGSSYGYENDSQNDNNKTRRDCEKKKTEVVEVEADEAAKATESETGEDVQLPAESSGQPEPELKLKLTARASTRARAQPKPAARPKSTTPGPKTGPESAATGDTALDPKEQVVVVRRLLKKVEERLSEGDVKASLADYIRLVQLQKELDEDTPKEIKVTWVEPKGTEAEAD